LGEIISSSKLARIISTTFVPPSFTIILITYFAFELEKTGLNKIIIISTALTFGFLFHIIYFMRLRTKGKISDNEASLKEERDSPYLVAIIFYIIGLAILILTRVNILIIAYWLSNIPNTLVAFSINKKWKISAHTLWVSGAFAAIIYLFGSMGLLFLPLIFIIGWSRFKLRLHTMAQILTGSLVGFCLTYLQIFLIVNFFA